MRTIPTFEDSVVRNSNLVRKALQGTVLLGRWPTAPVVKTLSASDGITVPEDYESVGWISDDGLTFSSDMDSSDATGWGAATVLRRDVTQDTKSLQFTALETKRLTKELFLSQDLSGVKMSQDGEVMITLPDRPQTKYFRVLSIGTDGDGDERYYMAKFYSKAAVTDRDDEPWANGDDPLGYNVTMTAYLDDEAGFAVREFLFGPGALSAAEAMGWEVSTNGGA